MLESRVKSPGRRQRPYCGYFFSEKCLGVALNYGLCHVAEWAATHGLPFPAISPRYAEEKNEHLLVFKRNEAGLIDPHLPTVLYFHNPIEKSTFEFNYTETEFDNIFGYMYQAVCASAQDIKLEIQEKIALLS